MKIGFIGLGIMGTPMSENIIKKHNDTVYVFDQDTEKAQRLAAKGAIMCRDSLELAERSELIISMVPKSENSRTVYTEILRVLGPGKVCVDMSTIHPEVSEEIADMVKQTGAEFLDAPVVKSELAARSGTLGIYVGGNKHTYEKILPILLYMGEHIKYMGENGKGLVMKICHNALVSQIQNGVNETLLLAGRNGISVGDYAEAVSYGGGQNFYLDSKKQSIEAEDFTTAFSVENMTKDIDICISLADACGLTMPGEYTVKKVYDKAMNQGYGKADFSIVVKVLQGR